ncbi:DNA alkylation repair protein [Schaalia sp. ZJ405]|uniref:DNA alkylation repair protein n=1 Tax=Schaalia sp. ZJ405 TaxID=2709403 RepID=UPI0013ED75CD|nr:DNA alkylation repair protein [Schaalia sp. ZJ405]QPK80682.1 DNA alkylation repair protein [Schaalia sp. ZJ405]
MDANEIVVEVLRGDASAKTAAFSAKLVPTVDPGRFLGVKSASMKKAAKALLAGELSVDAAEFRAAVPHPYVELDMIHVHTLNALRDVDRWRGACEEFLPYIDNWMVTDAFDPVVLRGKRALGTDSAAKVIAVGRDWLVGAIAEDDGLCGDTYRVRAGVLVLLQALLHGHFASEQLEWVASVRHPDYYVKMVVGWYFATAFDKFEQETRPFVEENGHLQLESHRLAVRKIIESRRTSAENLCWAKAKRAELRELAKSR